MKTAIILSLLSFLLHIHTNAQNTIKGRVTDKVTRQPLESATVTLQQGGDGNIINYTLTDADGRFQLSSSSLKDRTITVFYMGYRKKTIPVLISRPLTIELEQDVKSVLSFFFPPAPDLLFSISLPHNLLSLFPTACI